MLLNNKDVKENGCDFEEINDTLDTLNSIQFVPDKKDNSNDNAVVLPQKRRLALFLTGFAYIGLLLIGLFTYSISKVLTSDELLQEMLTQSLTYGLLLIALISILFKYKSSIIPQLKIGKNYLMGIGFGVLILIVEIIISTIMYTLYPVETNSNQVTVELLMNNYPTLMFIISVIIGPLCEEITYRVGLYGLVKKYSELLAIIVSALVFGLVHIDFLASDIMAELVALPIYIAIGALLTISYKKYGFACCFVAHAIINLAAFCITIFL